MFKRAKHSLKDHVGKKSLVKSTIFTGSPLDPQGGKKLVRKPAFFIRHFEIIKAKKLKTEAKNLRFQLSLQICSTKTAYSTV